MTREGTKVILWEEQQRDYIKKFYDLQFIPRVGEEIYLRKETWKVKRIEHDIEVDEVNIYMEVMKKSKQDKDRDKDKDKDKPPVKHNE
ncbi:hypothetical protein ACQFX9_27985 [Aliinostoc sp. HNIBRCY26]|uniref:hypothetical protein n=1 Tax=Aliinostoc sp. HNIBRCY26 TaxID=3418997 RepID=UPI003D074AF0